MELTKQDPEFWTTKEAFYQTMLNSIEEFKIELANEKNSAGAINGCSRVSSAFVNHIHGYTEHIRFEDITVANASTKFLAHVKWEGLTDWNPKEIKLKLRSFLEFLERKGVVNEKILEYYQKN